MADSRRAPAELAQPRSQPVLPVPIACLKRDYLWRRTLFDGLEGAQTWCGWGVFAHNTTKATALAANREANRERRRRARTRHGSDPPTPNAPPAAA